MSHSLKLIQISDLHLCADPDALLHGWNVEQAWKAVADDAMARHPDADLWVLSGDLVDDESVAGYQRLDTRLTAVNRPVLALAGNHDDPRAMARHLVHARVHASLELAGWRIHALNSHINGSDAGRLGPTQLRDLRIKLEADQKPVLICVHHPPIRVKSNWLDAIGLQDRDALCNLIREFPHVAGVLCGHAHQAMDTRIGRARCWITPSTMRQFLPAADRFALDTEAQPGYRIVSLTADGCASSLLQQLDTSVDNSGDKLHAP